MRAQKKIFHRSYLLFLIVGTLVAARQDASTVQRLQTPQTTTLKNARAKVAHVQFLKKQKEETEIAASSTLDPGYKRAYRWYLRQCSEKPLRTKSVSAAFINFAGDFLAQKFEGYLAGEKRAIVFSRMIVFFLCGLVYVGPFVHYWYDALFRLGEELERRFKVTKMKRILAQIATDQTVGVAMYFPSYFYVFEFLESFVYKRGPSIKSATKKMLGQLSSVMMMQYRIFPIVNGFNLAVIPPELRVLFSNLISIFWNMYLCTLLAAD